ncbi:hypothetical protein RB201_04150 [Streptomyces sp. S1A(2023)]
MRRIAGWCLLALIPLTFVALAALAGQLAELAAGTAIAAFLAVAAIVGGVRLVDHRPRNHN